MEEHTGLNAHMKIPNKETLGRIYAFVLFSYYLGFETDPLFPKLIWQWRLELRAFDQVFSV